ncbi:MAG: DUF6484 domain-containing protein [Isosphaeraceae bacterium]
MNGRERSLILGAITGSLLGCDDAGRWFVDYPGNPGSHAQAAPTTVPLSPKDSGKTVVLVFEQGNAERPIIIGVLQSPVQRDPHPAVEVDVDGNKVTIAARQELVLRCGKASITLTRAGKILLRGTYLLSRSTGVNSIKGGSVQVN